MSSPERPLVAILGPTAVGKTALSLDLCKRFNGEIIGADSRQIYRGMDIGTAKPTPEERSVVPHHLIDIRQPDEVLTLSEYQRLAYAVIDNAHLRGALPVLVGGTVLYMRAVLDGLRIPEVPPNPELRNELEHVLSNEGREALFQRLQDVDPRTAAVIDGNNPRRVIRALEIVLTTGKSKTDLEGADPPPYAILKLGLRRDRSQLLERIDRRVEQMVSQGLVEETRRLLAEGYDESLPAMSSLGYKEMTAYLCGELSLEEAVEQIKVETHRYLRHQMTWLRKMDDICWIDMDAKRSREEAFRCVETFLDATKRVLQ